MSYLEAIKNLLFTAYCPACDRQLGFSCTSRLCDTCLPLFSTLSSPLCPCCGRPFPAGEDHFCGDCLSRYFSFDRCRSLFMYRHPLKTLLLNFKFGGQLSALDAMAELVMQSGIQHLFTEPDLVLPVPLHRERLRSRGFNQSLLLARSCFPAWRHKISVNLLVRLHPTIPQTSLRGTARRTNLRGAFALAQPGAVEGKNILLIDDVFTTGSTLNECARILAHAGAARIEAFTMARAL